MCVVVGQYICLYTVYVPTDYDHGSNEITDIKERRLVGPAADVEYQGVGFTKMLLRCVKLDLSSFSTNQRDMLRSIIQTFLSIRPQEFFFLSMGIKCVIPQGREAAVRSRRKTYCVIHYLNHDTCCKYHMTCRCSCEANYGSNR